MANDTAATDAPPKNKDLMVRISEQFPDLSTGERAMLRRIYLTESLRADGVVAKLLHRAGVKTSDRLEDFAPWRLLAHVAALLSGTGGQQPHAHGRRLGIALHEAGYSETRLLRLTAARDAALHGQIIRAARIVAQAGKGPVNLWAIIDLVGDDADRAEAARIRTAQDYYAADARSAEGKAK